MVRRTHKYADGGKIVKDHSTESGYVYPKPTYMEAVKDRVKGFFSSGIAGKGADTLKRSKSLRDKQIEDAGG